ncbi:hypothetical protein A2914_02365 [Candidatus Nomurabacteria bacterium RIFCSPLOWO2_01_FULL_41_21]|uniref:Peptidase M10 metallopeptidase domain-containing protein n=1 Tax=Candidatus Nomurabacteria bacterium RIFCSPLOWO2_01_FULL_41_21 TaxID=1801776 RepID=A0A1F6X2Z6_9BACT|nr:MAG: hypothetical protein A2914_02365 [Candidatus Nomurabacteria bacterium RIFCSPLOWO2_01_FULL_41_21]
MRNITKKALVLAIISLFLGANSVFATPASFALPGSANEVAENVFYLGKSYDTQSEKMVEGYAIVHRKDAYAKPNFVKGPKAPKCYAVMASGAKWKTVEPWEVFAGAGLTEEFLIENIMADISTWESAAGTQNILGWGSIGTGAITDPNILDNKNQVSFANLESGTIAVTIVWGIFGGPTFNRELVAWDQIYNTDFEWTEDALIEPSKMDFWNIAIHELGHSMGLADIYNTSCSSVTMYGYGTEGETSKRTLESADIMGINTLY